MNGKLYIKKFIRDDGETLSFDAEEIYLSKNNTLLVRSDPATTAIEFTEEDGGEMIRQRGATYSQPVSGLIVPKSTEYWALCVRLSRFFILNHTYKIVYIKRDGSMFSMNRAWINAGLQIVPVPYENYSTWTIEFKIGDSFWTEYAEDSQGKEIYSNTVELPLLTAGTGGEVWNDVTQQTLSGLGDYFTIDGTSISASINELEVRGDTFQQSYSGKNLLLPSPKSSASSGLTASYDATTGVVTLSGTASNNWSNAFSDVAVNLPAGTYTFSATTEAGLGRNIIFFNGSTNILQKSLSATATSVECVVPQAITSLRLWLSPTNGTNYTGKTFKVQLEIGSQATSFEPYVGGTPAPNPNYPQSVQVVTGEQTVTVTGKNLCSGISQGYWITSTAQNAGVSASDSGLIVAIQPNTNYTISTTTSQARYRIAFSDEVYSGPSLTCYNGSNKDGTNDSITSNSGSHKYLIVNATDLTKVQIEAGSTATTYEPYQSQSYHISLGSTELCKIGDYQDYIYKSGGDWYVHKACMNRILDSSSEWSVQGYGGYTYISGYNQHYFDDASTDASNITVKSSQFTPVSWDNRTLNIRNSIYINLATPSRPRLEIRNVGWASVADVVTWFTAHPATIYYALATPTDTKITDATLVGQLNALAGAQAYNGKTIYQTDSATMPVILSVELLQSVGGGEVWDNVGAVWEEGVGGVQTINVETTQTTYPVWTVTGPCSNPTLQNDTTDTIASFDGMIASGQTLTVDFADNTAYLDSAPVAKYVSGYVSLAPGENVIGFNSDGGSTQTSTISWDNIIN